MTYQAREDFCQGGQTPCILNICADCDSMTRCPRNPILPTSHSTSAGHPVALDTAHLPLSFLPPSGTETIVDSLRPDDCALRGNARYIAATLAAARTLPNRISLDRHTSFTDLTQRSAYEFKFGLLAGRRSGFTLPDLISSRNDRQNFVSRSCSG